MNHMAAFILYNTIILNTPTQVVLSPSFPTPEKTPKPVKEDF